MEGMKLLVLTFFLSCIAFSVLDIKKDISSINETLIIILNERGR